MPESQLKPIAEGLWEAHGDHLAGAGAFHFPLRMTVVVRPDGGLVLISPIAIDGALAAEIRQLGEVRDILAPNGFHYLHAEAALAQFPGAQLWIAPSLTKKRPQLAALGKVLRETPQAWAPALSAHTVEGAPALTEIVVHHGPSRTLITTDLVFNMHRTRGWLMPLVLRLAGAWKRLAQSRYLRSQFKDRQAVRSSLQGILALDFDRLIMAHGDIVERTGHQALTEAVAWLGPLEQRAGSGVKRAQLPVS